MFMTVFAIDYSHCCLCRHAVSIRLSVSPSICPLFCHVHVLYWNEETYSQTFWSSGRSATLVFLTKRYGNIPTGTLLTGT